jgi:hypothetical protein
MAPSEPSDEEPARDRRFWRSATLWLVVGFWVAVGVVAAGPGALKYLKNLQNLQARLLHMLLAAQLVFQAATLVLGWEKSVEPPEANSVRRSILPEAFAVTVSAVFAVAGWMGEIPTRGFAEMPWTAFKVAILPLLGMLVASSHCWRILSVSAELDAPGAKEAISVARYLELRGRVRRRLSVTGAIISLAIFTAGVISRATSSGAPLGSPEVILSTATWLGGGLSTLLLIAVYVPAHLALNRAGHILAERAMGNTKPSMDPAPNEFEAWLDRRDAIERYLGLKQGSLEAIQASLSVLAPLLASLTTLAIGPK